jgi:hypothetical protein
MIHLESVKDYFRGVMRQDYLSKHNKMANLLLDSLRDMELDDIKVKKTGDKYSLFFRQEFIEVYRTPGGYYTLSVNNKMYDVSSFISKKIWNFLNLAYENNRFGIEGLEKKFK